MEELFDNNLPISAKRKVGRPRKQRPSEGAVGVPSKSSRRTFGPRPPKKGKSMYVFDRSFENLALATTFLEKEMCWSRSDKRTTSEGDIIYFRCNLVKKSGDQCSAKLRLVCKSTGSSSVCVLYRTEADHDHTGKKEARGLPYEVRPIVTSLYKAGVVKPAAIAKALSKRGFAKPKGQCITNFLTAYKRKGGDLAYEAMPNATMDEDEDEECAVLPLDTEQAQTPPPLSSPLRPYSVARDHPTPTNNTSPHNTPRKSNRSTRQDETNSTGDNRALEREVLLMQRETYSKMNEMISEARLGIFEHRLSLRGFDVSSCDLQMPPGATLPQQCSE